MSQHEPAAAIKLRMVFGPLEISQLTTAYDRALTSITENLASTSRLTGRELRHRLAASIFAQAQRGQLDPEMLSEGALRSLARNPS